MTEQEQADQFKKIALEIRNVSKSFGDNQVLKNVSLDVFDGELLVLLGPSGCGKTTLLRIINGLLTPDAGAICLQGKDITRMSTNDRDMGFVFQSYALFPHMDVAGNVAFGLRMRKIRKPEIRKRVEEMLEIVHLAGFGKRKINQLSGGQQQRVALARALVLHPSLLLMDEPLSNLDAKLRASVRVEIAQIQKELGITTILVTHDQVEAMTMADRIVLMQEGVIQQVSKPIEVYEYPTNSFVAGFVGSPSINFLKVKVEQSGVQLVELNTAIPVDTLSQCLKGVPSPSDIPAGEYLLGVRPEDLMVYRVSSSPDSIAKGTITFIEPLGSETLIHLRVSKTDIVSRLPRLVIDIANLEEVEIGFRPDSVHLFDINTWERVNF